ncbi:MAG: shikimate dehydrogenase [Bacillus thermozeamaize]|uniref:Shikimate dehydrogenase (NADP(+)) n=1 Tax=Bacillus thermozeamaize TaxID=230954 RepID=A0A1Y3PLD1_9BACI|nr:MAG: shikimate dehydrogenase [Bacillus thermozeamaize]
MVRMVGLLGHPVGHSFSPRMHNAAFRALALPYHYEAFDVLPERLAEAVRGMKALGFRGFNVTIPHKVAVMSLLDEVSGEALGIGAINTVVIDSDGKLYGTNTDGLGYLRSLQEEVGMQLSGAKVMLLGAGGAARAVGYALLKKGVDRLWIANRSRERAEQLAAQLRAACSSSASGSSGAIATCSLDEAGRWLGETTLLINTTSVGMHPDVDQSPLAAEELRRLPEEAVVSDLIYNPRKTRFLSEAERCGLRIHGGLGMFLYQGAEAFRLWTGKEAPLPVMRLAIEESGGNEEV